MNFKTKKDLRVKAIVAYCNRQFGCDSINIIKAYNVETRKPVTVFEFHHDYGTFVQDRVHENEMVQNVEHNGHRESLEKFIKEFIANEKIELKAKQKQRKARQKQRKAQANTIGNLCPQLVGLR